MLEVDNGKHIFINKLAETLGLDPEGEKRLNKWVDNMDIKHPFKHANKREPK